MYLLIAGKPVLPYKHSRIVLENITYPEKFVRPPGLTAIEQLQWDNANLYCYEFIFPGLALRQQRRLMLEEINKILAARFNINAFIDKRKMSCWVVELNDSLLVPVAKKQMAQQKNNTTAGDDEVVTYNNTSIPTICSGLEITLKKPVIDESGVTQKININIPRSALQKLLEQEDAQPLQNYFNSCGLKITLQQRFTEVLVLNHISAL